MIIDCISDTRGHYPELEGGNLLIVAGDLTAEDTPDQFDAFFSWLSMQNYNQAIVVGGNHDNLLAKGCAPMLELDKPYDISIHYLCDSGCKYVEYPSLQETGKVYERKDLKIWGSPWTKTFPGMNPNCKAFTVDTEEELADKFSLVPHNIDILVTHSPPFEMLDELMEEGKHAGSQALENVIKRINPKLHVFGHIHEGYGKMIMKRYTDFKECTFVNASHVNERYEPVNNPIRVVL